MLKICGRCYRLHCRGTIVQEASRERRCILCSREPEDQIPGGRPAERPRGASGRLRREPAYRGPRKVAA